MKATEMFTVNELSDAEMEELKQTYYTIKLYEEENREPFMSELVMIDELVSDDEVKEYYSATFFVSDDFFCNC